MSIPITPATKIAELLDAYPQLEDVLIQQSPHFKALKNPILRKTVAKVATLEKASQMSGIPVRRLVAALREAAGLPGEPLTADLGLDLEPAAVDAVAPDWFDEAKVALRIDADDLLAKGEVPLPRVHQAVQEIPAGTLLCVKSAFRPAPLLEALHKAGHRTYVTKASSDSFHTYVCPRPTEP
jgi:hypothetical protein